VTSMIRDYRSLVLALMLPILAGCNTILDITKDEPIEVTPFQRSMGAKVDDNNLATIIKHNINKAHPDLSRANVQVHSFNAVVLLVGEVPSEELKLRAQQVAAEVPRVRQVYNELAVRANSSFLSRSNDSLLRQRINFRLSREAELRGVDMKVVVEDSVAYLMGLTNAAKADAAAHEASLTSGVRRVVKLFEYVQ
jgi:osmotically-inducible protein OsmY